MKLELSFLLSDYLIFFLFALALFSIYSIRKDRNTSLTWKKVFTRHLSMISFVILCFYGSIALVDSVHFKSQTEEGLSKQKSLLNLIVHPLGTKDEKTYSAPFASKMFVKSLVTKKDGTESREYAPLKHAALGIDQKSSKSFDLLKRILKGSLWGSLFFFLLITFFFLLSSGFKPNSFKEKLSHFISKDNDVKGRTALITLFSLSVLSFCLYQISLNYHILGTSQIGQDIFYEGVKSIRTGLMIGTLTTLFILPFSLFLGTVAGYFGGKVDDFISYIYSTISSIPSVLLISASILVLQVYISNNTQFFSTLEERADARLLMLCLVLGMTSWAHLCRLLRGETLKLRELNYIKAAKSLGTSSFSIIRKHIVPNIMHIVLITIVLDFSSLVLAEAVLSYVGVGVDPTTMSWGNMINSSRLELAREPAVWWPLLAALIFMFVLILSANIFSDAVRDAFDPKLKGDLK